MNWKNNLQEMKKTSATYQHKFIIYDDRIYSLKLRFYKIITIAVAVAPEENGKGHLCLKGR